MKILKLLLLAILCAFIQSGCTTESTSDLIDDTILDEITYTNTVKSVIDNNCIVCHAAVPVNGAPMPLVTYENVKDAVLTRGLIDRISREQGASGAMPLGGNRLPQVTIDKISQWAQNGTPE
jgi:uncharacterized membrane protein